jgi:hypothetical protein
MWLFGILAWVVFNAVVGAIRLGSFRPLSMTLILLMSGLAGVALFALIAMEPRYVAPFSFLVFAGLVTAVRVPVDNRKAFRRASIGAILILILLFGVLAQSSIDQSVRSLYSTGSKPSYQAAYFEQIAVKDFLKGAGVKSGDQVAVIGFLTLYWGRMAGVKVVGHIEDLEGFVKASSKDRASAIEALRKGGFKAIIGKGALPPELADVGWRRIPKAKSYYGIIL